MEEITQEPKKLDLQLLNKELDWVMAQVFLGNNSAFYGTIMAGMNFLWTTDIQTAQTNGINLWWNPDYFLRLPRETRKTMLVHELMHPAKLHFLRKGNRDHRLWNYATDIRINNDLEMMGFTFQGWSAWKDILRYSDWAEEDIYDDLVRRFELGETHIIPLGWSDNENDDGDMTEVDEEEQREVINRIIIADQIAQQQGEAGLGNGTERLVLNQFLAPVVPWENHLNRWMSDLADTAISWSRPNRRIPHIYMPTRRDADGRLDHLMYFLDVSGSIQNGDIIRFNSELYYIKKMYNPRKLTMVQFDDGITKVDVINENDEFEEVEVIGRGGTRWKPVKEYIDEHKPTAAIIFTDMGFCDEIIPLEDMTIPVLWVILGSYSKVPFGKFTVIRNSL